MDWFEVLERYKADYQALQRVLKSKGIQDLLNRPMTPGELYMAGTFLAWLDRFFVEPELRKPDQPTYCWVGDHKSTDEVER